MKQPTITVKQPWASLIIEGIKDIENRTWPCPKKYIGKRVLIHAGKTKEESMKSIEEYFRMIVDVYKKEIDKLKEENIEP